jgi:UrcA family protein
MLKILCTSIALLACTAPASAETWRGAPWVHAVSYADLELSRPADRAILFERIQAVGEDLCRDRTTINGRRRCVNRIVDHAIAHAPPPAQLALRQSIDESAAWALAQH